MYLWKSDLIMLREFAEPKILKMTIGFQADPQEKNHMQNVIAVEGKSKTYLSFIYLWKKYVKEWVTLSLILVSLNYWSESLYFCTLMHQRITYSNYCQEGPSIDPWGWLLVVNSTGHCARHQFLNEILSNECLMRVKSRLIDWEERTIKYGWH